MTSSDGRRSGRLRKHELALVDILIKRAREKGLGPHDVVQFPGDALDAVTDAATQVANVVTDAATSAADAATAAARDAATALDTMANQAANAADHAVNAATEKAQQAAQAVTNFIDRVNEAQQRQDEFEQRAHQQAMDWIAHELGGDDVRESIAALAEQLQRLASMPAPTLGELIAVRDMAKSEARKRRKARKT